MSYDKKNQKNKGNGTKFLFENGAGKKKNMGLRKRWETGGNEEEE